MNKLVSNGKSAMDKILEGVNLVTNPVKSTLGAKGKTVIISEAYIADYGTKNYPIVVTKDGWRVSQSISSIDPLIQAGVLFIQEAAQKTMTDAGDATTTTCLLAQSIVAEGLKMIESGANPHELKLGIEKAVEYVVGQLKEMAIPIDGDIERIRQVATISANNDSEIGNLIAEAYSKIGVEGSVTIEEAKGVSTSIKIADGFKFHRGWASPYFITNLAKEECELIEPYVLIYDRPVTILKDLMPILQKVIETKRPLIIICEDSDGEALATLTFNSAKKKATGEGLQSCVINMSFMGENKIKVMEDIAAVTGGTFINELKGVKLENVTLQHLGQAGKILIGKENTVIIGGQKKQDEYDKLVLGLKELSAQTEAQEEKEKIDRRIARLNEGVAILSIGATTEVEMKEKRDRADDSVRATKCAIEEGFIVGGGTAFLRIKSGNKIVDNAIYAPLKQILSNAGVSEKKWWKFWKPKNIIDIVKSESRFIGYNAKTGQIEDLVKSGIIDAVKSNRCALQNAASVACQILTSQYVITDTMQ